MTPLWACLAGALVLAIAWDMLVRTPSDVEVTRYRLAVPGLPGLLDGIRVVFVSDLHHRDRAGFREAWVRAIVPRLAPDLILLGGDLVEARGGVAPVMEMIAEWKARLGVYAVFGNNEEAHMDVPGFTGMLEARGVRVLRNGHVLLGSMADPVAIAGVADPHYELDDLEAALAGIPAGAFTLLLSHTPETFPAAAARGVPLVFAGHTHGGQVRLPWLGALWTDTPRTGLAYQWGHYRRGGSHLVLTKGIGCSKLPIRWFCRPEVVVVELQGV